MYVDTLTSSDFDSIIAKIVALGKTSIDSDKEKSYNNYIVKVGDAEQSFFEMSNIYVKTGGVSGATCGSDDYTNACATISDALEHSTYASGNDGHLVIVSSTLASETSSVTLAHGLSLTTNQETCTVSIAGITGFTVDGQNLYLSSLTFELANTEDEESGNEASAQLVTVSNQGYLNITSTSIVCKDS